MPLDLEGVAIRDGLERQLKPSNERRISVGGIMDVFGRVMEDDRLDGAVDGERQLSACQAFPDSDDSEKKPHVRMR